MGVYFSSTQTYGYVFHLSELELAALDALESLLRSLLPAPAVVLCDAFRGASPVAPMLLLEVDRLLASDATISILLPPLVAARVCIITAQHMLPVDPLIDEMALSGRFPGNILLTFEAMTTLLIPMLELMSMHLRCSALLVRFRSTFRVCALRITVDMFEPLLLTRCMADAPVEILTTRFTILVESAIGTPTARLLVEFPLTAMAEA